MTSQRPVLAACLALLVVASVAAPSSARASVGTHRVPEVLAGLARAARLADPPPSTTMSVGVAVARPGTAGEASYERALYDRASPLFHHWLTPATFNAAFGVRHDVRAAVRTWLTSTGAKVASTSSSGDWYEVSGTVSQMDRLFSVHVGRYSFQHVTLLANSTAPSVPVDLPITAVTGLDTAPRAVFDAKRPEARPTADSAATTISDLTSRDVRRVYDLPASATGQGQVAGIFAGGDVAPSISDLRSAEHLYGYPRVPVKVVDTQGGPASSYVDTTGDGEWTLDLQALTAMAPDLKQVNIYNARENTDVDIDAEFSAWADDPAGPRTMSASFGDCEYSPTNPVTGPLADGQYGVSLTNGAQVAGDPILAKAALMGRTLFSGAGDTASGCFELVAPYIGAGQGTTPDPIPIALWPGISAHAVDVAGTVVTTSASDHGKRISESTWTFSGGGPSHITAEPDFQKKVANIDLPCQSQADGTPYVPPTTICRGGPDVAALSGTGGLAMGEVGSVQGMNVVFEGKTGPAIGTSLSTPLVAGMWADVQSASRVPGGLGFANETFYRLSSGATAARDFHDITTSEEGAGDVAYRPGPGWDYASGLGTLDVAHLIQDADGTTTASAAKAMAVPLPTPTCTATLHSGADNAYDTFELSKDNSEDLSSTNTPSFDVRSATLTTSPDGKTLIAVLKGPALSPKLPRDSSYGDFFMSWQYAGRVWFARAKTDGKTVVYVTGSSTRGGTYYPNPDAHVIGTFPTGTLTMRVPAASVGSPPRGALLTQPLAYDFGFLEPHAAGEAEFVSVTAQDVASSTGAQEQAGQTVKVGSCTAAPTSAPARASVEPPGLTKTTGTSSTLPTTGASPLIAVLGLLLLTVVGLRHRRTSRTPGYRK